jgi:uncharacterized damage-inducible protein DinB
VSTTKASNKGASPIAELDVKRSLLESFAINERANQKLLERVTEAAWRAAPPSGKGRTIAGIASHIHNVRLMWLAAADKSSKLAGKLNDEKVSRQDVMDALSRSAKLLEKLLETGLHDPAGRIPNFKPDVVVFAGYLIAHDAHHRGQISMLCRQLGMPMDSKISFGLWEWGTLWKECGFSR